MSKNTGGPAFARPRSADPENYHKPEVYEAQEGISLRDYFAAKAMQGMISSGRGYFIYTEKEVITGPRAMAPKAYEYADAMLAERAKP